MSDISELFQRMDALLAKSQANAEFYANQLLESQKKNSSPQPEQKPAVQPQPLTSQQVYEMSQNPEQWAKVLGQLNCSGY